MKKNACHTLEDRRKKRGGEGKNFLKNSGPLEIFFVVKVYETLRDSKYKFAF